MCICDVLIEDKFSVTTHELEIWASYIIDTPVRPLYGEGRKIYNVLQTDLKKSLGKECVRLAVNSLDISVIKSYRDNHPKEENLLMLGNIFEVLGKNSKALLSNKDYAILIRDYVNLFIGACDK